jgi:hypothetical protein
VFPDSRGEVRKPHEIFGVQEAFMNEVEIVLDIVKITGAATAFIVGLAQYRKAQRWKRAEFVANEVKEFNALHEVRNAKFMLDWTERYVDLYPEKEKPEERRVRVTDDILIAALAPHSRVKGFTQDGARIRDTFDEFFGRLERFENFIAADLISKEECEPYLAYWLDIIGMRGKDAPRRELARTLQTYIREYQYDGVESLLSRFGYQVKVEKLKLRRVEPSSEARAKPDEVSEAEADLGDAGEVSTSEARGRAVGR